MTSLLPIVHRELMLASRRKGTHWTRCAMALLVGGLLLGILLSSTEPPARKAETIFWALKGATFIFCLFAGVRYTADALSVERREGTLGLLFLTDLRGYDVVIGKLTITSLNAFFGVLGALPLLAVPVLIGGVSAGEVYRVMLVLINTLFFSLTLSLAISAFGVHERNVLLASLGSILLVTFGLPLCWFYASKISNPRWLELLFLVPSPAYTLKISTSGLFVPAPSDFWPCMLTVAGMSLACVATASVALPRASFASRPAAKALDSPSRTRRPPSGHASLVAQARRRWQLSRPYGWRVSRDRSMGQWGVLIAVVVGVFGLYSLVVVLTQGMRGIGPVILPGWTAAHWLIKLLWTAEACRPFSEDKSCGALELLLCTPLQPREMTAAQCRQLERVFALPIGVACVGTFLLTKAIPDKALAALFAVNLFLLPADCWALRWKCMHFSLAKASFARAFFRALGQVLVPPWIALVLFMSILGSRGASESTVRSFFLFWGVGVLLYDFALALSTQWILSRGFRRIASGDVVQRSPEQTPAAQRRLRLLWSHGSTHGPAE